MLSDGLRGLIWSVPPLAVCEASTESIPPKFRFLPSERGSRFIPSCVPPSPCSSLSARSFRQDYDGGDCCPCTCESDDDYSCGMYGSEFNCLDPSAPCFGVVYKQQMSISENGHAFKVSRFADGRSTPYRIYFWDELLTGSSYRFDGNGDLVYFKAGSEVYYDIYKSDVDGDIKFSLKAESSGGESPEYDVKSDDPVQDIRENEFSCYQCWETVSAVCGDGRFRVGGLYKFCGAIDLQALDNDGTTSAEILCENADNTCSKAVAECASYCGVGE